MSKFRKKPVEIEAFRLGEEWPDWFQEKHVTNEITTHNRDGRWSGGPDYVTLRSPTGGVISAERGYWIIRCPDGGVYAMKPDIFAAIYEPVDDPESFASIKERARS